MVFSISQIVAKTTFSGSCSSLPRCRCKIEQNKVTVDCSYSSLLQVPVATFHDSVTHLHLVNNGVKFIERGAFRNLHKLEYLDLSFNRELTFAVLPNVTSDLVFTSIKILKLKGT